MPEIQKFGGSWKLFEKEKPYQGELHISYDKRIIALELIIPASEGKPRPRPPYKGKIPYICGTLFSGAKILLYDCSTGQEQNNVMDYTRQIIHAKYAFWGLIVNSEEEIKFTKAIFDFGDIIEWSGLCHYEWELSKDGDYNLKWFHKEPFKFKLSENLEITLSPSKRTKWGVLYAKEITFNQNIKIEFAYKNPTTWDSIMEDALCLQYLIGLGINQFVDIYNARYSHSSIYFEFPKDDGTLEKRQEFSDVIIGTGKIKNTQNTMSYEYLYTLDAIKDSESDVFIQWRKNYSMLKPVLDLYFTAFSNTSGTPEMLFINLVQALETYHARFIADDSKDYINRVENLVNSFCKENINKEGWKNFLLSKEQESSRSIFLISRLADLVFAEGKLPFALGGHPIAPSDYIKKIRDTRNYYTHYNPAKLDKAFRKSELPKVNSHLLALLEYHLLVLLGFDADEIRRHTIEKIDRIDNTYQIQNYTHVIED